MKRNKQWGILLLIGVIIISTAAPVYAASGETELPPLPEWPVIGPVLRWLGIAPAEETEPAPDPARIAIPTPVLPEQQITNLAEAEALWQAMEPGEQVRVFVADEDINAILKQELEDVPGVRSVTLTTEADSTTLNVAVDRAFLEEMEGNLPFFVRGDELNGKVTLAITASDCRPDITVDEIKLNTRTLPIKETAQALIDKAFEQAWREQSWLDNRVCIEAVRLTDGETILEGYRK